MDLIAYLFDNIGLQGKRSLLTKRRISELGWNTSWSQLAGAWNLQFSVCFDTSLIHCFFFMFAGRRTRTALATASTWFLLRAVRKRRVIRKRSMKFVKAANVRGLFTLKT